MTPPDTGGGSSGLGAIGQLLILIMVLALLGALVWIIWQFVTERQQGDDLEDADELDHDEELEPRPDARVIDDDRPPARWRRAAARHRELGEFRDAIRCEYRALVGDLARAGYVDEIPGRTSGEERDQVAAIAPSASPVVARFDGAAERFDRAWFDDAQVTAADDERFLAEASAVLDQVLGGSRR